MKIYEIGTGYTPIPAQMGAATEIVVEELTRSLRRNGETAEIIDIKAVQRKNTALPIIEVCVPRIFTKTDVSLGIMHKLKRVYYSISLAMKLKTILKQSDEQVALHFYNQYNHFFFLKLVSRKLQNRAIIGYTVHSYVWGTRWNEIEKTVKKKYFQEIYCVRNADIVFVLNDITVDHFVNRLSVKRERVHKILNGVNVERYAPLSGEIILKLKRAGGLTGKKVVFQVGSVCPRKNQLGSIKMLARYMQDHTDVVFMYAGGIIDAAYQESIKQFAAENGILDQIKYVGELSPGEQLNRYYNIADCCIFTSALESFGLVVIEAISSGTPIIVGSNLMFSLESGYSIYHNTEEFVSLVDQILQSDPAERSASEEILENYSWDSVALMYSKIFKEYIKQPLLN